MRVTAIRPRQCIERIWRAAVLRAGNIFFRIRYYNNIIHVINNVYTVSTVETLVFFCSVQRAFFSVVYFFFFNFFFSEKNISPPIFSAHSWRSSSHMKWSDNLLFENAPLFSNRIGDRSSKIIHHVWSARRKKNGHVSITAYDYGDSVNSKT